MFYCAVPEAVSIWPLSNREMGGLTELRQFHSDNHDVRDVYRRKTALGSKIMTGLLGFNTRPVTCPSLADYRLCPGLLGHWVCGTARRGVVAPTHPCRQRQVERRCGADLQRQRDVGEQRPGVGGVHRCQANPTLARPEGVRAVHQPTSVFLQDSDRDVKHLRTAPDCVKRTPVGSSTQAVKSLP